mmetsp:Transcript_5757/g.14381  ORF Transcript_5757/g.14381 Transcript_5757/m.14381 type:complete len:398 (+) Transcript_5757:139-1332(+)
MGSTSRPAVSISQFRSILVGAIGALFINNLMISISSTHQPSLASESQIITSDFHSTSNRHFERQLRYDEGRKIVANEDDLRRLRNPRILFGIFSSDNIFDGTHRKWHRHLFNDIWKDQRVCSLDEFRASDEISFRQKCELVYTFVAGSSTDPDAPTERLEETDTADNPIEYPGGMKSPLKEDINWPDVTHLNIRENMNDGKSQTWFYFASKIAKQFEKTPSPIDYVVKFDSDSMLKLHDFFEFAHTRLPPAPYNKNIFAGSLRNKGPWYFQGSGLGHPESELSRYESYWGNEYDGVHLYLAGQCYLMSIDLAAFVAEEAPFSKVRVAKGGYIEGHEDHDIAAMVYHNPSPITLITIGKSQRFWEHPVKGAPRYLNIVKRETARVNREPFEGKILKLY